MGGKEGVFWAFEIEPRDTDDDGHDLAPFVTVFEFFACITSRMKMQQQYWNARFFLK